MDHVDRLHRSLAFAPPPLEGHGSPWEGYWCVPEPEPRGKHAASKQGRPVEGPRECLDDHQWLAHDR